MQMPMRLIPPGADAGIAPIFAARALRGFADGFVAVLLPVYLLGLGFASIHAFWPLLLVALVGTLNPSAGDGGVFLPLEHARLARRIGLVNTMVFTHIPASLCLIAAAFGPHRDLALWRAFRRFKH